MKGRKFVMSRFATLAWSNGKAVVVSPVTARSLELPDDGQLILLNRFRKPLALSSLAPEQRELAEVLIAGGMLVAADGREERGALQAWEPHDLSFHVLSRRPRKTEFRLRGSRPPEPLFVPRATGTLLRLVRPGAGTTRHARSFWEVLDARVPARGLVAAASQRAPFLLGP